MTRCEMPFETLSAYADGELDPQRELEVRRHLDGCDRCGQVVEALLGLKESVASTAEIRPVPHALREQLSEISPPRRAPRRRAAIWLAVAATAILALAGVGQWAMKSDRTAADRLAEALLHDHIRYLEVPDAIQVASDNPARIADSFDARVGFPIRLPRFSNANLLGARFCWVKRNKAVLSFYESSGRRFSLFVLDRRALPGADLRKHECRSMGQYQVCLIPGSPQLLAMVADRRQAGALMSQLETFQTQPQP